MTQYRKKPVVIEAVQFTSDGDHPNVVPLPEQVRATLHERLPNLSIDPATLRWIGTLEGGHIVMPGDFIITGVQGEQYPCKPDIFEATYSEVGKEPFDATAMPIAMLNAVRHVQGEIPRDHAWHHYYANAAFRAADDGNTFMDTFTLHRGIPAKVPPFVIEWHRGVIKKYYNGMPHKAPGKGVHEPGHLLWMLEEIAKADDYSRANRWLGWVQDAIVTAGYASIIEVKDICRAYMPKTISYEILPTETASKGATLG